MTAQFIPAPKGMDIPLRRLDLEYQGLPELFIQDNPVLTALLCSLSGIFPEGERQFIASVRHYQDQITDPELKQRIRGFIGQEAHHGRENDHFNDKLKELGWRIDIVEKQMGFLKDKFFTRYSPERQLAQTVAMEHLTAVFANHLMNNPEFLGENPHEDIHKLFLWHAIEETEHKSVAFDVYQKVSGNNNVRKKEMRMLYPFFLTHMIQASAVLLFKKGYLTKLNAWRAAYKAIAGLLNAIKPEIKAYYENDFHPWQEDNSEMAKHWIKKLSV